MNASALGLQGIHTDTYNKSKSQGCRKQPHDKKLKIMKKVKTIAAIIILLLGMKGYGQCPEYPNPNVVLTSQAEVDQFGLDYPNCTVLSSLAIRAESTGDECDVSNLLPLNSLETIYSLSIHDTKHLQNLSGFENLQQILSISIANNDSLVNLAGLEQIESVSIGEFGGIHIENNKLLTNIHPLSNISSAYTHGNITIRNNPSLESLKGLDNIMGGYVAWGGMHVRIINNDRIKNLHGLEGLQKNWGEEPDIPKVIIEENDSLISLNGLGVNENFFNMYIINNASLSNLDGIENQENIYTLRVEDNESLLHLNHLQTLENIHNLYVENNDSLLYIDELMNIDNLHTLSILNNDIFNDTLDLGSINYINNLVINNNNSLISISSLPDSISSFRLRNNESLLSVENMNQVPVSTSLNIFGNSSLTSLPDFAPSLPTFCKLWIIDNSNLSICHTDGICQYLSENLAEDMVYIYDNAPGCNTRSEVEVACMIPTEEIPAKPANIRITPNPASTYFEVTLTVENQGFMDYIRIFDGLGRLVFEEQLPDSSVRVETSDWVKGMYFVIVNERWVKKVVIN